MYSTSLVILRWAIVAMFMLIGYSYAETVNTTADVQSSTRFSAYINTRPVLEILYRLGVDQDKKLGLKTDCKSQFGVHPLGVIVMSPIELPDNKQNPTKGVWLVRYALQRCGDSKAYNSVFSANAEGGTPKYQAYFPGSTIAHPVLVKDAMVTAMGIAMFKGCGSADVLDMRVTAPPHSVRDEKAELKGVWNEMWTFKSCNQTIDVPIVFIPNIGGAGTSFKVNAQEVSAQPINPPDAAR